ncbi:MAG: hypothetical protein COA57_01935 [Flavobacteriales bacterium]|nr:MAG: hypothetical protein COA57_01935 [Flavobacteriales bacterium]
MMFFRATIIFYILNMPPFIFSQEVAGGNHANIYKKPIPYAHLREADVMWMKRIWREIDLRQKINHPLYYPVKPAQGRMSLFDVIVQTCTTEYRLAAYSTGTLGDDDMFTQQLTIPEFLDILMDTVIVETVDPDTEDIIQSAVLKKIESEAVKKYLIKEDWFFDNQRSVLDVRIIGICPLAEQYNEYGEFKGYKKLFWITFPKHGIFLQKPMFLTAKMTLKEELMTTFYGKECLTATS